jgi:hypothetical protein
MSVLLLLFLMQSIHIILSHITLFILSFIYHTDFQDEPVERDTEAIKEEAERWVQRCKSGASVVMSCWIGWIVAAQLLKDTLPSSWFMFNADDTATTGW